MAVLIKEKYLIEWITVGLVIIIMVSHVGVQVERAKRPTY